MAWWNREDAVIPEPAAAAVDPGLIFGICFAIVCFVIGFLIWYCMIRKKRTTITFAKTEKKEDGENLI